MDIILLQDIDKVGNKFEIVTVKNGYARNYLIPQKMAIIANKTNRRKLDDLMKLEQSRLDKMIGEFQAMADKMKEKVLRIGMKVGTTDKIFGSITNVQIAAALKEQLGLDVDRKLISIPEEVKTTGTYHAVVNLHSDVDAKINFEVVGE